MKTDTIEFDTQKEVNQIVNILRTVKCQIQKLEDDPFSGVDGPSAAVAVVMFGKATFADAFKHFGAGKSEWGVQVYVYDLGNKRHVEMIALGESGFKSALSAHGQTGSRFGDSTLANQYFNMRHSKDYRDKIVGMLA